VVLYEVIDEIREGSY